MIPESYKVQKKPCKDCKHCFRKWDYEEPNKYFCNFFKSKRPKCQSVVMEEWYLVTVEYENDEQYKKANNKQARAQDKWDKWAEKYEVNAMGTCNEFERKE